MRHDLVSPGRGCVNSRPETLSLSRGASVIARRFYRSALERVLTVSFGSITVTVPSPSFNTRPSDQIGRKREAHRTLAGAEDLLFPAKVMTSRMLM